MKTLSILLSLCLATTATAAQADLIPAKELEGIRAKESVFAVASRNKPIVLKSTRDGEKYFGKEALVKLSKAVDFQEEKVLVFAWRGSGGDRLTLAKPGGNPGQVQFIYRPGRTRDLRPHVKVFVIGAGAQWTVK